MAPIDRLVGETGDGGDAPGGDQDYTENEVVEISQEHEPIKIAPSPTLPSPAEVEEHNITHIPYRSWCSHCAKGRGLGEQRGRHAGRCHTVAIVGIDYFYITADGLMKREELEHPVNEKGDE